MQTITFGPYENTQAWLDAEEAGFVIAGRESIDPDQVVTIPSDIEYPVQEDATAWLSTEGLAGSVLFVELPSFDERAFPAHLRLDDLREFESQWKWPVWYERTTLAIPAPANFTNSAHNAIALIQSKVVGSFEITSLIEALGIGQSGQSLVEVRQPPRSATIQAAIETVAKGVSLPATD